MRDSAGVVDALIRNKPPIRCALHDNPWQETVAKWIEQGLPADEAGNADCHEHFGFDLIGCGGWFDWHPKPGCNEVLDETDDWTVARNGSGATFRRWKNRSGTPEHLDFAMSSRDIWERDYKPHLLETPARDRINLDSARDALRRNRERGFWTHYGSIFIWEGMRGSLGDVNMYMALAADPGWIHDYCRTYTDLVKECYRILIDEAGRPDGVWLYEDLGYKGALFCSPKTLSELIFPYYAELVAMFHDYDLPVVLHTCGFTEPALDLIVEAGFDGLHPMEIKAGNRPLWIGEQVGDRLMLVGGLDARILESGDRDRIRRSVTDLVEGMKARGVRYVYASDHSVSPNVDYADFKLAVDVYREHMWY
jgi:uroporphyrinogen decarboxylase